MRALALDIGTKTIGLAVTDEASIAAHPLPAFPVLQPPPTVSAIKNDALPNFSITRVSSACPKAFGRVSDIVRASGSNSPSYSRASPSHRPAPRTRRALHHRRSRARLAAADVSRARRREVIDSQAAVLILQAWLDARSRSK